MINSYIYENNDDETLSNILLEIKKYTLKEDIFSPYMEKETLLYNHPALNKISEYAIKTDTFNFINADYFKQLSNLSDECNIKLKEINDFNEALHQEALNRLEDENEGDLGGDYDQSLTKMNNFQKDIKNLINNLPNIKIFNSLANNDLNSLSFLKIKSPIVKITDKFFLDTLKINKIQSYKILEQEIDNIHNDNYDSILPFTQKDKKFLINFKQETLPNFINIFNKLIKSNEKDEALHFSEFFSASVGQQASQLTDLGFSIFVHSLFSHDFNRFFSIPMIKGIYNSENINENKRHILINEGSQLSNDLLETISNLTIKNKPFNRKNYGI